MDNNEIYLKINELQKTIDSDYKKIKFLKYFIYFIFIFFIIYYIIIMCFDFSWLSFLKHGMPILICLLLYFLLKAFYYS